jgi:hypothetical protein
MGRFVGQRNRGFQLFNMLLFNGTTESGKPEGFQPSLNAWMGPYDGDGGFETFGLVLELC